MGKAAQGRLDAAHRNGNVGEQPLKFLQYTSTQRSGRLPGTPPSLYTSRVRRFFATV